MTLIHLILQLPPTDINNVASLINEGLQSVLISDYIALKCNQF